MIGSPHFNHNAAGPLLVSYIKTRRFECIPVVTSSDICTYNHENLLPGSLTGRKEVAKRMQHGVFHGDA